MLAVGKDVSEKYTIQPIGIKMIITLLNDVHDVDCKLYFKSDICDDGDDLFLVGMTGQEYKKSILKGRNTDYSLVIINTIILEYFQSCHTVKDIPVLEESLSKVAMSSVKYAKDILGERFLLGEETIRGHIHYRPIYEKHFGIKL